MIFDCFTFYNELDLLEIRLHELSAVVDKFVLVEATRTYSGLPKSLYYADNRNRFAEFDNRIVHVIVDDMPGSDDAWEREYFQRNAILRGLKDCGPDDVVLISDVDEIPRAEKLLDIREGLNVFSQTMHYYYLNVICENEPIWYGTRALKRAKMTTPQEARVSFGNVINNGGWHFSYLGGSEAIRTKLQSFAHQEYNTSLYTDLDYIDKCIEEGRDFLGRDMRWKVEEINLTWPKHVVNNLNLYEYLVMKPRKTQGISNKKQKIPREKYFHAISAAQEQINLMRQDYNLTVQALSSQVVDKEQTVQALSSQVVDKEQTVQALSSQMMEKEQTIQALSTQVEAKEQAVQALSSQVMEKEQTVQALSSQVMEKEQTVQALSSQVAEKEQDVQALLAQVTEMKQAAQVLKVQVAEKEQTVQALTEKVAENEVQKNALIFQLREITISKSWRLVMVMRNLRVFLLPMGSLRMRLAMKMRPLLFFPFTLRRKFQRNKDVKLIRSSGLFDPAWYLAKNPDVAQPKVDPLLHYLAFGGSEGRDPGPNFPSAWYLEHYEDVRKAGINPLLHYLKYGRREGRLFGRSEKTQEAERDQLLGTTGLLLRDKQPFLRDRGLQNSLVSLPNVGYIKASVIIPNFNGQKFLGECLDSLYHIDFPREQYEIIVVDNASTDNSRDFICSKYTNVVLIKAEKNLGFAAGCNLGIKNSRGEFILLLNNDTVVEANWLKELVAVVDRDKDVAIVGSKLLYKNNPGEIQNAMSYITDRGDGGDMGSHQPDEGQYDTTREVMAVCGASMLIRRTLIEEIGGLDEDFWAYYEDTDLCYRARLYGKKIVFASKSVVYHIHAATSGEWSPFFTFLVFRNKLYLHLKNSPPRFLLRVLFLYSSQVFKEGLVKHVNLKTHTKVLASFFKNLPKFLIKRFYIRTRIKQESDNKVSLRLTRVMPKVDATSVRKVCIYNAYLPTMGGGENLTAHIIEYINKIFPSASIDILCHETEAFNSSRFFGIKFVNMLEREFGLSLNNTHVRFENIEVHQKGLIDKLKYTKKLSSITKEYDLFINITYGSVLPASAKLNIYYCMFPSKLLNYGSLFTSRARRVFFNKFLNSYHLFFAISQYTQSWIDAYWGVNSFVLYPPVNTIKNSINPRKENIILSVGRFFVSGHNKKQFVMINTFIEMFEKGWTGDWKLVLAGRKHTDEESCKYIRSLEEAVKGYPIELRYDMSAYELEDLRNKAKIYWHATGYGEAGNLNPDRFEHFGLSTIEATQYGVVPVVFNAGGQPEIIEHARNGFLWNTKDELKEYTRLLMDNKILWKHLSRAASEVVDKFSKEKQLRWFTLFLESYYKR